MAKNILSMEAKHRKDRDESAHIYTSSGELVTSFQGKGAGVDLDSTLIPKDSIITHNHPRSLGEKGLKRIGNSFSNADVLSAVSLDVKEMRAVTPTYTFSIKRPKDGWGADIATVSEYYNKVNNEVYSEFTQALRRAKWDKEAVTRMEVLHNHEVIKRVSNHFGWNYTKKRG